MITAASPSAGGRGLEKPEEPERKLPVSSPRRQARGRPREEREVRFNPGICRMGISPSAGSTALGQNFVKSLTKWNQYFRRSGGAEISLIIMSAGGGRYGISIRRRSLITFHSYVMDGPRCCLSHDRFAPEEKKNQRPDWCLDWLNSISLFTFNVYKFFFWPPSF